jgi:integrative and conjugative element protein (TIGR02256 family)
MLTYTLNESNLSIILTDNVLNHFERHRQVRFWDKEAGGQLFARFEHNRTLIQEVTGSRPTDKRSRHSYRPDRLAEQREILEMFDKNFHYVGDWHTHPSPVPSPSGTDVFNISSCVASSEHELNGFLMIIVGTNPFPEGLRISLHTAEGRNLLLRVD